MNRPGVAQRSIATIVGLVSLILSASLVAGCVTISSRSQARDTVSLTLDVPIGTPARVETFNGGISVSPSGGSTITADVVRRGEGADDAEAAANRDAIAVTLEMVDGVALLRAVYTPDPASIPGGSSAGITLRVPPQTALQLVTSNGPIGVRDTWGGLDARTSNGPVDLSEMVGNVSVETSNGPVDVEAGEPVALQVRTSNGGITFDGSLAPGDHRLETSNGPVTLSLPPDAAFSVDARTSANTASSDFVVTGPAVEDSVLQGVVGSPEAAAATSITIRTSNSPIAVKQG
jgi:hypothetical protein